MDASVTLPVWLWKVPYVGTAHPQAVPRPSVRDGANCQLFAYEVLGLHGLVVPDLWSSELWEDEELTCRVDDPKPLDLVLFSEDLQSYGAHVGVVVGEDLVLHLCREVGHPVVWTMAEFASRPRYAVRLGFKRVRQR